MDDLIRRKAEESIGSLVSSILHGIGSLAKNEAEKLTFDLSEGFREYIDSTYERCSKIKTLIHRNVPIYIERCYVVPCFNYAGEVLVEEDIVRKIANGEKIIISAHGGLGKTVFMKMCFIRLLQNYSITLPVYIELRQLKEKDPEELDLLYFVYAKISAASKRFTRNQFDYGLARGGIALLLDGFDELPLSHRSIVERQVIRVAESNARAPIVLSSRPNKAIEAWTDFSSAELQPMTKAQTVKLISSLDFDAEKKSSFLASVVEREYDQYKSFLSSPLLATMMLLTYDQFGEIPNEKHVFYDKAFQVLTREHDAMKPEFTRELYSGIKVDDLEDVFMNFCVLSYLDQVYEFSYPVLRGYVDDALEISEVIGSPSGVEIARDFIESISIMFQEGDTISFVHRSFQEYFFARYVCSTRDVSISEVLGQLDTRAMSFEVIEMIHDMDPMYMECEFVLPNMKRLKKSLSSLDPAKCTAEILSFFIGNISVSYTKRKRAHKYVVSGYRDARSRKSGYLALEVAGMILRDHFSIFYQTRDWTHEDWIEEGIDFGETISIRRDNQNKMLACGLDDLALRLKEKVFEYESIFSRRCAARRESRSKHLLSRIRRARPRH